MIFEQNQNVAKQNVANFLGWNKLLQKINVANFLEFLNCCKTSQVTNLTSNTTINCLLKAAAVLKQNPNIDRHELYATVLRVKEIYEQELAGTLLFEIYLVQKTSNGVCESFGRIGNIIHEGCRAKMGLLFLETNIRLYFVSPLERAYEWFEYIRKMWIHCGAQKAACSEERQGKRRTRTETVDAVASESASCFSSQQLARKRKFTCMLAPLLNIS